MDELGPQRGRRATMGQGRRATTGQGRRAAARWGRARRDRPGCCPWGRETIFGIFLASYHMYASVCAARPYASASRPVPHETRAHSFLSSLKRHLSFMNTIETANSKRSPITTAYDDYHPSHSSEQWTMCANVMTPASMYSSSHRSESHDFCGPRYMSLQLSYPTANTFNDRFGLQGLNCG